MYSLFIISHIIAFVKGILKEFSEKLLTKLQKHDIISMLPKTIGVSKSYRGNFDSPCLFGLGAFLVIYLFLGAYYVLSINDGV